MNPFHFSHLIRIEGKSVFFRSSLPSEIAFSLLLWHVLLSNPCFYMYKLLILFDLVMNQEIDSEEPLPENIALTEIIMLTC